MDNREKQISLEEAFYSYFKTREIRVSFKTPWELAAEALAVIRKWHTCARCNQVLSNHAADGSCYTDGPEKYVEI